MSMKPVQFVKPKESNGDSSNGQKPATEGSKSNDDFRKMLLGSK